ncbi:MAG TPA: hypothetical protein VGX71_21300 [Pseudaminobacter sp.]|jgi:hypothetical protein|nr:hypothetical protein [Pseudaminobacter sp.]
MPVPSLLTLYILSGSLAMIAAILIGLGRALTQPGWSPSERKNVLWTVSLVLLIWFAIAIFLAVNGAYSAAADSLPTIQFGLLIPVIAGVALLFGSVTAARVLAAVPMQWLVGVQLYRVIGGVFVVLWLAGSIPGLFALPAGIGDIAVGVMAPFVAARYARNAGQGRGAVAWWNAFGVFDLVVALTLGLLTSPSPLQLFAFDRPNIIISEFPLILIPTFLVPLSIMLHVAVWIKLAREKEAPGASSYAHG